MDCKAFVLTALMTVSFSNIVFAAPTMIQEEAKTIYTVSESGLLTKENTVSIEATELRNACYDGDVLYSGIVEDNTDIYLFENGYPVLYVEGSDGYHFSDNYGKETEYREDIVEAFRDSCMYYEKEVKADTSIYTTTDIRDFHTLIQMISDKYSNVIYPADMSTLIETSINERHGTKTYSLNITSSEKIREFKRNFQKTNKFLDDFNSIFTGNETEKEICIKINNFIKENFEYDYEKADAILNGVQNTTTISDVILGDGKIICYDYSNLYIFLCELKGIKTTMCRGMVDEIEHSWNKQEIDGEILYTDVTFNDANNENNYLLISYEQISFDHIFF